MVTCYVASLGTIGETTHKLMLRICGCLLGAAMGVAAIVFVIPHLTSVGGLMALVFIAALDMTPFEPHGQRPPAAELRPLYALVDEISTLLPAMVFSPDRLDDAAAELDAASTRLEAAARGRPPAGVNAFAHRGPEAGGTVWDSIGARVARIGTLAAGGAA